MNRKYASYVIMFLFITMLAACSNDGGIEKVGILTEGTLDEKVWDQKGYDALLQLKDEHDFNIYTKTNINNKNNTIDAVDELSRQGVNLIFGHSSNYGRDFVEIASHYPDLHFVYFNGSLTSENVTSLNFDSHAMGFFAGMLAAKMTKTNQVGVIAAYEWQPEIEGFFEGVKFENPDSQVRVDYIYDWNDKDIAVHIFEKMREKNVDVFYPTGDSYSKEIIRKAYEDHVYAIGYLDDEAELFPNTVLSSTVQHIDKLYEFATKQLANNKLNGKVYTFDFQDDAITMENTAKWYLLNIRSY
ncbi:BMP family ABC transporter substrate-binding protein [Paracerasibacillus soli]|uniref:BMP family ABC transporter substrate-binding protein n=1 Tax=Paracerasibacillus soli TaxID=480284 RepID=A0ABU5CPY0_9BACI|nr:BMP family ABC transporter substrate-binding protein [Virgibacillus soli]MDY0407879.1 BMP family ABC transporter substrate-binding protein [Virgibacillus soli]